MRSVAARLSSEILLSLFYVRCMFPCASRALFPSFRFRCHYGYGYLCLCLLTRDAFLNPAIEVFWSRLLAVCEDVF
jgi:hypothetical protein